MLKILKGVQMLTGKSPLALATTIWNESFIVIKLSTSKGSTSKETLEKLLCKLTTVTSPFSNLRINDGATGIHDRMVAADGWYFPTIVGCRIPICVKTRESGDGIVYEATMYVSPTYRDKLDNIIRDINPIDYTEPKIYIFASNDNIFNGRLENTISVTYSGRVDLFYADQHQLIDPEMYQRLDKIFKRLITDKDWYRQVGRQLRETFLLYGPPGTGKTSLIRHFAAKYRMNIIITSVGRNLNSVRTLLAQGLHDQPTIILFEDIDTHECLLNLKSDNTQENLHYLPTISDSNYAEFLNFLDGVRPLNNVAVVMTTNHIGKLKDGIYRVGRVNHLIELTYPSFETVVKNIGFKQGDSRLDYLLTLETKQIPLDTIVSLRSSGTLEEVKDIIASRDRYFTLSEQSGDSTACVEKEK